MKKMKKIAPAVILSTILLMSMIPNDLFKSTGALSEDLPVEELLFTDEEEKSQLENFMENLPSPDSAATYVAGWWNGSFQYRTRVELTNSEAFSQAKPIDLYLEFDSGVAHKDSLRVVKFSIENEIETWTPIPTQIWNETVNNPDVNHLASATVTFIENYLTAGTTVYYVYYDDDSQVDTTDYSDQIFTANLVGQDLTVNWDDVYGKDYRLSLSKNYGATELVDQYLNNLHTDNSSSPGSATLDQDLVAYWNFDDDTPTEQTGFIPGGSGTGYIEHGGATYGDSQTNYGRALVLDGTGDYVAINADHTEMGGYGTRYDEGITIMAWINLDVGSGGERIIASWDRSEYWRFSIDSSNRLYFSTTSVDGIDDFHGTSITLDEGTWYHVAASYEPSTGNKYLYVNGELKDTKTDGHTPGNTLHPSTINHPRYGFFGTGSEASSFDGAAAPASYFEGKIDEIRVYNNFLDAERIDTAKIPNQLGYINTITEVKNGPVLAIYDVEWYPIDFNGGLMDVVDSWYFYRSLNMWKVSRTYSFDYVIDEPTNFGAFHTLFNWDTNDPDISEEDYYFYDGQSYEGHDDLTFTPNNYTVVYDYDGDNRYNALGLFITNISESYSYNGFSDVEWRVDADEVAETVNFVPGNYTNLINLELGDNITVEFWEFLRTDYVATPGAANTYFNNIYTALSQETTTVIQEQEFLLFNLEVNVEDIDSLLMQNVNVSLYNYTGGGTPNLLQTELTDENGEVTFTFLPADDYTVNFTYSQFDTASSMYLGYRNVTLNQTEMDYQNVKTLTFYPNTTNLELHLMTPGGQKIVGAMVEFYQNSTGSYEFIGNMSSNNDGNVTLNWFNFTNSQPQIRFRVYLFDGFKLINYTGDPTENISVSNIAQSFYDVDVQIADFETSLNLTDLTPTYVFLQPLMYNVSYTYNISNEIKPIYDAEVTYQILREKTVLYNGIFTDTNAEGNSVNTIDYDALGYELETNVQYKLSVTASKAGYRTLTEIIYVQLLDIPTTFAETTGQVDISLYWDENLSISFLYNDTFYDNVIENASVTFEESGDPSINGILRDDGLGWYTLEINTSEIFPDTGIFNLEFSASQTNYTNQFLDFQVTVLEHTTLFTTLDDTIEKSWRENFTLSVSFFDTHESSGITDGKVSYSVGQIAGFEGNFTHIADGIYELVLNTTDFGGVGSYTIHVTAERYQYASQSLSFYIDINPVQTRINNTILLREDISINVTTQHFFEFKYSEMEGTMISGADDAYFEWEDGTTTYTGTLQDLNNGYYRMDFETLNKPVGTYLIAVHLGKQNFVKRFATITLNVLERPVAITLGEDIATKVAETAEGNPIVIEFSLTDPVDGTPLTQATVTMDYLGAIIPIPETDTPGTYRYVIETDTGEYNALIAAITDTATISIQKANYTIDPFDITISVTPPEFVVGNVGLPKIFVYIGASVALLAIAIAGTNQYIRYARIPLIVKQINSTKKLMGGNKTITDENLTNTYEEEIIELYHDAWDMLDLDLKKIIGGSSSSPNIPGLGDDKQGGI